MTMNRPLAEADPEVFAAIDHELKREQRTLELIASENFTSRAVMEAQGGVMTNKYAEGLPGKRYYGGCEHVDVVERLAIERGKQLFGANFCNAQPHSGAQANAAVYLALLKPGDTIMGMALPHGGHLTHGSPVNLSGILYHVVPYGLDTSTGRLDMDRVAALAREHKPKLIVAGASAYPRILDFPAFRAIADEVGALLMVDMAHIAGLVAAGVHPSPIPHAHVTTTTTHKTLRGPRGGLIFSQDEELAKKFDKAVFPGTQGGPLMHVIAAKAVALGEALQPGFQTYQRQVVANAQALAKGLVARGLTLVSGGTDNHLMLIDLKDRPVTGKDAEKALEAAGITVNKNAVPDDPRSPFVTSGLRVGTPAVTTRGCKEPEMDRIAGCIAEVVADPDNETVRAAVRRTVDALCDAFPLYGDVGAFTPLA